MRGLVSYRLERKKEKGRHVKGFWGCEVAKRRWVCAKNIPSEGPPCPWVEYKGSFFFVPPFSLRCNFPTSVVTCCCAIDWPKKTKLTVVSPQLHVYHSDLTIFQFCERRVWMIHGLHRNCPYIAQIMSWVTHWKLTQVEDRAYSPMVYGEGTKEFRCLQLEIIEQPKHLCVGKLARRCLMLMSVVFFFACLIGIDMTIYSGNRWSCL